MSERGSFATSYIYCPACFAAATTVLLRRDKTVCSIQIPGWPMEVRVGPDEWTPTGKLTDPMPIIAGKIGAGFPGGELMEMEELLHELSASLCPGHSIRVAVLSDSGEDRILRATSRLYSHSK